MRAPRCPVTDDGTDSTGNQVPPASAQGNVYANDGGPLPRTRGSYAGFLPAQVLADLRSSAASGAGLVLMDGPHAPGRSSGRGLILLTFATIIFLAGQRSR